MRYRPRMLADLVCAMVVASRFCAPAEAARAAAIEEGIGLILKMQEGEGSSEWPYEGV